MRIPTLPTALWPPWRTPSLTFRVLRGIPATRTLNPPSDFASAPRLGEYWVDTRPMRTITLEGLMAEHGLDWIDVLKLDCEGCELGLLERCQALDRVGLIVGEYHGRERFLELVGQRFADWKLEILRDGDPGTFWLTNPGSAEPTHGARAPARSAEHDGAPADSNPQSEIRDPQSLSLLVNGGLVELTADHALRFTAGADGTLAPRLSFRGREILQPWSLDLAAAGSGIRENSGAPRSGIRKNSGANGAIPERANDDLAPSEIQNPKSQIQNRPCRHLGGETHLRECPTCQGNVRVKVFACAHPAHVETTLAECGTCADYWEREQVTGDRLQGTGNSRQ